MTKAETEKIMARLMAMKYHQFGNSAVSQEWTRALGDLEHVEADAVATFFIETSKECPTINEFREMYKKNRRQRYKESYDGTVKCWVCMDKGYFLYKEKVMGNMYEYVAYCDRCDAGPKQKYIGTQIQGDKNPYYTPAVSKLFDVNRIIEENKAKDRQNRRVKPAQVTKKFAEAVDKKEKWPWD